MLARKNPLSADRGLLMAIAADGGTRKDAARELGVSFWVIKRHAPGLGVKFTEGRPRNTDRRAAVMALLAEGVTTTVGIARRMGKCRQSVRNWLLELEDIGIVRIVRKGRYTRTEITELWEDNKCRPRTYSNGSNGSKARSRRHKSSPG